MILFLDARIVIYWVEAKQPFYQKLISALQTIRKQHPSARFAVSRLSLLECRVKPLMEKDPGLLKLYAEFFAMKDLEIIELDASVIDVATELRVHHGLRTPDALQAASALEPEEPVLFLSSDPKFKKISELDVKLI